MWLLVLGAHVMPSQAEAKALIAQLGGKCFLCKKKGGGAQVPPPPPPLFPPLHVPLRPIRGYWGLIAGTVPPECARRAGIPPIFGPHGTTYQQWFCAQ